MVWPIAILTKWAISQTDRVTTARGKLTLAWKSQQNFRWEALLTKYINIYTAVGDTLKWWIYSDVLAKDELQGGAMPGIFTKPEGLLWYVGRGVVQGVQGDFWQVKTDRREREIALDKSKICSLSLQESKSIWYLPKVMVDQFLFTVI